MKRSRVLVLVAVLVAAAGACGGSGSQSDSASFSKGGAAVPGAGAPVGDSGDPASLVAGVNASTASASTPGRAVISTATLRLQTDDVAEAKERAVAAVVASGGILYSEQSEFGDRPSSTLTLKVPPDQFRPALSKLAGLGTVDSQEVATEDVTDQVVDLEARRASLATSVNRLGEFLSRAGSATEVSQLEGELARREGDLEKVVGQQRALEQRIDLATIVLTVTKPAPAPASDSAELPSFLSGLAGGWKAFLTVGSVTLAVVGALLPFLPVMVAVYLGMRLARSANRRRPPAPAP